MPIAVDDCAALLHAAGWSVGEACALTDAGPAWRVSGTNGENALQARGTTQAESWGRAIEQARSLGMLGLAGRTGAG